MVILTMSQSFDGARRLTSVRWAAIASRLQELHASIQLSAVCSWPDAVESLMRPCVKELQEGGTAEQGRPEGRSRAYSPSGVGPNIGGTSHMSLSRRARATVIAATAATTGCRLTRCKRDG